MSQAKVESNPWSQVKKSQPTVMQSMIIGSVAGAVEVGVDHPLFIVKTRIQRGLPCNPMFVMRNLPTFYRGIVPNATSMIPITALQVGANSFLQQSFSHNKYELSNAERLGTAFTAGAISALVASPTEMIMTHQRAGFYATASQLVKQGGWSYLYKGLPATMLRDGMFGMFFLEVSPLLKKKVEKHCPSELSAKITAGAIAGVGATLASHSADVVKTAQQAAKPQESSGVIGTMRTLYSSKGVAGFFSGIVPRGTRVVSAVTIMSLVNEQMKDTFSNPKP